MLTNCYIIDLQTEADLSECGDFNTVGMSPKSGLKCDLRDRYTTGIKALRPNPDSKKGQQKNCTLFKIL